MKGRPVKDGDGSATTTPPSIVIPSMKGRPVKDGDADAENRRGLRRAPSMKGRPVKDGDFGVLLTVTCPSE